MQVFAGFLSSWLLPVLFLWRTEQSTVQASLWPWLLPSREHHPVPQTLLASRRGSRAMCRGVQGPGAGATGAPAHGGRSGHHHHRRLATEVCGRAPDRPAGWPAKLLPLAFPTCLPHLSHLPRPPQVLVWWCTRLPGSPSCALGWLSSPSSSGDRSVETPTLKTSRVPPPPLPRWPRCSLQVYVKGEGQKLLSPSLVASPSEQLG